MTNNADPGQLASKKPTDLDVHCLQRQGISGFRRTRVNVIIIIMNIIIIIIVVVVVVCLFVCLLSALVQFNRF